MNWQPLLDARPDWAECAHEFTARLDARFADDAHGDMSRWRAALAELPNLPVDSVEPGDTVTISGPASAADRTLLKARLMALHPWRKGPFKLFDVKIDTEWRSDWKWRRLRPHLPSLAGRQVLDVGCGNGYFGWRMLEAGASLVVGVDPTLVFCMQHRAINHYLGDPRNWVLPLGFEELPPAVFDAVFSMGVVYHRRDPLEHIERLWRHTRPGGTLVLESLVVLDEPPLVQLSRYARMRNVWILPTPARMVHWLEAAGFTDVRLVDVTPTRTDEQRTTDWMRFESLAEALDPQNPTQTVEGLPAPVRAIVLGRKPG